MPEPGDYTTTPDGYSCLVLLTAGENIVVWLTNIHWPSGERYKIYSKTEWPTRMSTLLKG